jgi:hypothetical protein
VFAVYGTVPVAECGDLGICVLMSLWETEIGRAQEIFHRLDFLDARSKKYFEVPRSNTRGS